jgi:TPR repeat protein
MDYYNKYIKYKTKYLELKYDNQYGGGDDDVPCDKVFSNGNGTCWAVAIQEVLGFGHFTSKQLKKKAMLFNNASVDIIKKNVLDFINKQILKIKDDIELRNVFEHFDIFSEDNIIYVKNILYKFIERYYKKVINTQFTPELSYLSPSNQERCEYKIAINFKKLFDISDKTPHASFGGFIYDEYLFCNLLSIFFLDYKVSFTNYYDNFNTINFERATDLGILINIPEHTCCLFICDNKQKFYNDNDHQIYECEWIQILKESNPTDYLYIKRNGCIKFTSTRSTDADEMIVDYLTVISKHNIKDTELDSDIKTVLQLKHVRNIVDRDLQFTNVKKIKDRELQKFAGDFYQDMPKEEGFISKENAIIMYTLAAEQNDVDAKNMLGFMYYEGNGVTQDYEQAKKWYTSAAEQGNVYAKYMLGIMYYNGEGVTLDYEQAEQFFTSAAEQNDVDAKYMLGFMYYEGNGVTQDYEQAKKWYTSAAEQGYAKAQYKLGVMYYYGEGVTLDYKQAKQLFILAANQGNLAAQYMLGIIYYETKNYNLAKQFFSSAAEQGYAEAQYMLEVMYDEGNGVAKD